MIDIAMVLVPGLVFVVGMVLLFRAEQQVHAIPDEASRRRRVFWPVIWVIHLMSIMVTITVALRVRDALVPYALPSVAAVIVAVIAALVVFAVSRVLLWRVTRPYASTTPARLPAWDRARLCNIEPTLLILAVSASPKGLPFPTLELVGAALALVGWLIWFVLKGPLERLNARDAARNAERTA